MTITIYLADYLSTTQTLLLFLSTPGGGVLNLGGDALTESPADSGYFVATVSETLDATTVYDVLVTADGAPAWYDYLGAGLSRVGLWYRGALAAVGNVIVRPRC